MLSRFSHAQLFVTPCSVASQAPLSTVFSRQEYWNGCHFLLQGIFPAQGLNLHLLHGQAGSLPLAPPGLPALNLGSCSEEWQIHRDEVLVLWLRL